MSRKAGTVVACYTLDGKLVKVYESARKACQSRHLFSRTIDRCIRGELATVKGMQWRRFNKDEVPNEIPPLEIKTTTISIRPVAKLDENKEVIEVYPSIKNAAKSNNIDPHTLRDILNQKYGYVGKTKYRYLNDREIEQHGFRKGSKIDYSKKAVVQYSLDGQYIRTYPSLSAAKTALGKSIKDQGISQCLSGKYETAYGYIWKYRDLENVKRQTKPEVYIFALNDKKETVKRYNTVKEASIELGISVSAINSAIRLNLKAKGFYWKRQ